MGHSFKEQAVHTDKFSDWHRAYLPVYKRLFLPWRDDQNEEDSISLVGNLLEIGNDGGGGLLMYAEYFNNFQIYGIDINPVLAVKDHPRITHYVTDAYAQLPTNIVGNAAFDIIIDDGSHFLDHQKMFVKFWPQLLTPDGIAIVEDIQKPEHIEDLTKCVPPGFMGFAIDLRYVEPRRYDNLLFCIQRI